MYVCMYVLFRSIQHQRGTIYTVSYDLKYVDQGAYLDVLRLLLSQRLSPGRPIEKNHININQYKGIKYEC